MNQKIQSAPELASIEVDNVSRSAFLMRGVLAAGAAYGALATGPFLRRAFAQGGGGDIDILNFGSRSSTSRPRSTTPPARRSPGSAARPPTT